MPLVVLLFVLLVAGTARADDWAWGDTSINALDWTARTYRRTNNAPYGQKKDFVYLEAEGGRGGTWGDLYGFFDVENPTHASDNTSDNRADRRTAAKIEARFKIAKLGSVPLMAYGHIYDFDDHGFDDQDRVYGLGVDLAFGAFTLKPFLGFHNEFKTGVGAQDNGGMGGYVLAYPFRWLHQSLLISQWHETEFARHDEFLDLALASGGKAKYRTAENGAIALWWNFTRVWTTGLSYRYAENKLAIAGYEDALIYTLRYNFH